MKTFHSVATGIVFLLAAGFATEARAQQDSTFPDGASFDALIGGDSTATTAPEIAGASGDHAYGLLPDHIGPMESFMWSEHGLMRRTFDMPLTREEREKELSFRRTMLKVHQIGGFTTLAALIGTVALGQMAYNGNQGAGDLHGAMAGAAIASYFTTASLAIFTPPPAIRRGEWSTVSTHKLLATIHFTGMLLTPAIGASMGNNQDARRLHLVSAYTTTTAFAAALLVVTL